MQYTATIQPLPSTRSRTPHSHVTAPAPSAVRPAVLIPTYNNSKTLSIVVERVLKYVELGKVNEVLVVNDGSTDDTAAILRHFGPRIKVYEHKRNRGKGAALRNGFRILAAGGFTHAITIDSDGQLFADDLPRFVEAIEPNPRALVVGQRDMHRVGAPWMSLVGLWISNLSLRALTGISLTDTQTGFRSYPLEATNRLEFRGTRFDFEMEVLVKSVWQGIPIVPIPIQVSYQPEGDRRISHFRPVRDGVRIAKLNIRLLFGRLRGA